ncbi:hypothetical protein DSM112329_01981 [Paraconexibacter sp. AEG42_29]|uniref:Glycosyl transferase family 28 C-terminal domain-containing protein n=1 Tax=Paraconexibacter sp. AEG42_29 TaxID=2997339 RepID=A0AAU7AUG6_9ACTN
MIGYYVHHHGRGHATRAACIAAALAADGVVVTGLGSGPVPDGWAGPWVSLARDDDDDGGAVAVGGARDETAGGALHWAPPGHRGLRERAARLLAWAAAEEPAALVVDVSVEVAVLARAAGVPVVVVAMPGDRRDAPHALAYRLADAVIAPWPAWASPMEATAEVRAVGAISRFDGLDRGATRGGGDGLREVVVLSGAGGSALTSAQVDAARDATPGWAWTVLGPAPGRWEPDPWPLLCRADVVVTHAGQNAIAEVAAARAPAVVVPQERPFGEQVHLARVLAAAGLAGVEHRWPVASRWPDVLRSAVARGGDGWSAWAPGDGAAQAAGLLSGLMGRGDPVPCAPR